MENSPENQSAMENENIYHSLKYKQKKKYEKLKLNTDYLAVMIKELCPENKEKSLALIKLEEVVLWARVSVEKDE